MANPICLAYAAAATDCLAGLIRFWDAQVSASFSGRIRTALPTTRGLIGLLIAVAGADMASVGNVVVARHAKQGVAVTQANAFGMAYGGLLTLFIHFIKRYRWTANASVGVALVIAGMLVILTPQKPFSRMYHPFYAIRA